MQPRPNPPFSSVDSSMESAYEANSNYYQAQSFSSAYYNSHYLQAYAQSQPQTAYSPNSIHANVSLVGTYPQSQRPCLPASSFSWYHPGNHRCTYGGCSFTGSAKSVEIHMMDRHLIYPPGWDKRTKTSDWDADPSLKGKPIPIQGTNVVLDSPEVLEAWIAERKKMFPTSARVEDKKRKMEEAIARGQLDLLGRENKRRKTKEDVRRDQSNRQNHAIAGCSQSCHNRTQDGGWGAKSQMKHPSQIVHPTVESDDDEDNDEAPEPVSSKVVPRAPPLPFSSTEESTVVSKEKQKASGNRRKLSPLQPKIPAFNPFATRPKLLRSLLLPEIRVTVSNLSQAIRFLVDNDFLRDVELKPGQAAEGNRIEVVQAGEKSPANGDK